MTGVRDTAAEQHRDKRGVFVQLWRQLPFFVWLVAVWMLLWGQFTLTAFVTGVVAAVVVTRVFRLPPVELSGRVNLWYGVIFVLSFLVALVRGSLTVAWQVLDWRRQPGAAIIAVPMRVDDDLIMTHTAVTASLIPGSLIVEADRDRRILYLRFCEDRTQAEIGDEIGVTQMQVSRLLTRILSQLRCQLVAA